MARAYFGGWAGPISTVSAVAMVIVTVDVVCTVVLSFRCIVECEASMYVRLSSE
jgi:hypothetical protein